MTRYVVDAPVVVQLLSRGVTVSTEHTLLAPTLLRSQVLSLLHEASASGDLDPDEARRLLSRFRSITIRLLGDAVLRRRTWEVADQLGWSSTYDAEYVALTQLQGDFFVTLDDGLARSLDGVVAVATIDDLVRP